MIIEKLWFLRQNDDVVGVFDDYEIALEEKEFLINENYRDSVSLKQKVLCRLPENSEEFILAKERNYI